MPNIHEIITQAYSAFNRRDIDAALALMTETVDWPKASEGGRVIGKEGIRAYWARQWSEFNPRVEPLEITDLPSGKVEVKVHQFVNARTGETLSDQTVVHIYTIAEGFIARMDILESKAAFQ